MPQNFPDVTLNPECERAVRETIAALPELDIAEEDVSMSAVLMEALPEAPLSVKDIRMTGHFRGDANYYPASVVKTFYAAYGYYLEHEGRLSHSDEDLRAFRDMIQDSSNDATCHVLNLITGTTDGPELPKPQMEEWMNKRQAVNRWLETLGITGINACQKTWNEGPYGRELLGYGPNYELRNMASANSFVRIMEKIARNEITPGDPNNSLLQLFKRDLNNPDGQTRAFMGTVMPLDAKGYYSKAGLAYEVRHDLAYLHTADDRHIIICVMIDHHIGHPQILPMIAANLLKQLKITPREVPDAETLLAATSDTN